MALLLITKQVGGRVEGETKKNKKYQEKIDDIISFFKIAKSYF